MASASLPGHAPARPRPGARLPPDRCPPDGPAYLRIVRSDGVSMAAASVFGVRRQINAVAGDVASAKVTRGGSLLIQTISNSQNEALLGLRHFLGKPCEVTVAEDPNTTEGLIHCPQLRDISEESILYELEPQGVCEVQRLRSKVAGEINPLIRLRFRGEALPTRIFCGYLSVQVRPWIPGPRQCRNCWGFGHGSRYCRQRRTTCGRCAENHSTDGCTADSRCCLCGDPHPAWDRGCRIRQTAQSAIEQHHAANPAPRMTPEEWPELPPHRSPLPSPERQSDRDSPSPPPPGIEVTSPPPSSPPLSDETESDEASEAAEASTPEASVAPESPVSAQSPLTRTSSEQEPGCARARSASEPRASRSRHRELHIPHTIRSRSPSPSPSETRLTRAASKRHPETV